MALTPGTRLGPYEVTARIGVGGMGEVYRATDTNLKRAVAIKVLPDSVAADAERLARFQREAEVLASLNHPNIAAIYGLERSGGSTALVMELVEGPTLADRVAQGAIPLDEALPIARQIAEALDAAHEAGVMHRDLKPANIKVRPDGRVKVLDFGLAKALDPRPASDLSHTPTMTSPAMTGMGVILGTAAYMSPEQARGKTVDKRADIWAFGAVLFEMLAGRRPFDGEDMTDVLGAVVRLDPPWEALPADVPPPVRTLLQSCLVKDPRQRVANISIALFVLDKAASLGAVPVGGPQTTATATSSTPRGRLSWMVAFAVAALLAVALAIPTVQHLRETPLPAPPETRVDIVTPATTDPISFALSPDGRHLVFVASEDGSPRLWLRSLDSVTAQPLAGTEGAAFPFWAPDSRAVAFFVEGKLKRLEIGGGLPQTLADAAGTLNFGGTWSPDGVILFSPTNNSGLFRVPASGGEPVRVTTPDPTRQLGHVFPSFLAGGRQFLFYVRGTEEARGIYLGSLDSADTTRLTAADTAGLAAPGGWLLYVRQGTLVARRFDAARGALSGDPVTVAESVRVNSISAVGAFSVSAAGLVAYRTGGGGLQHLTWFDRAGTALGTLGARDENDLLDPELSPDGRRVAVDRVVQNNTDVWLVDAVRTTRVTFDPAVDHMPIWSPDGGRIVFDSTRGRGGHDFYQKPSSGAGGEEQLPGGAGIAGDWSPDGRFLLYSTGNDLWVLPMAGDRKPQLFLSTNFFEQQGQFSPDGRWVAYQSNESGRFEVYVRPFPGSGGASSAATALGTTGAQWQVSTAGGVSPRWRPDGKELYYMAPDRTLMAVPIAITGPALEPGTPRGLFRTRIVDPVATGPLRPQYDVAPDGRFLINVDEATASPITLLQNWDPEGKK